MRSLISLRSAKKEGGVVDEEARERCAMEIWRIASTIPRRSSLEDSKLGLEGLEAGRMIPVAMMDCGCSIVSTAMVKVEGERLGVHTEHGGKEE